MKDSKKTLNYSFETRSSVLLVVVLSIIITLILCLLLSSAPLRTISLFFGGPLRNLYSFGNMLNGASVLIFGGLGISIALRSGNYNLGGEGQIYLGGFVATITGLALGHLGKAGVLIAVLAGALASGLMAGFSGWCKMRWKTNEMISSFLLSSAMILIVNYLITGPYMDPGTNLLSTRKISADMQLTRILEPSNLSTSMVFALLCAALVYIYLNKTRSGYILKISGRSYRFAVYSGMDTRLYTWLPMALSGAFLGLGGALSIFGTYYSCMKGFSGGMGWNSFAVALIAQSNPIAVIPASIFFSWIESGSRIAMQGSDVSASIASIIQASVFFLVTCQFLPAGKGPAALLKKTAMRKGGTLR